MRRLTLKEEQQISMNILKEIHRVCKKNNIRYFLAYGTLIGASRHKGFIPWDDDVDIWVPISEYAKFISAMEKETDFYVIDCRDNDLWIRYFSKISDRNTIIRDNFGDNFEAVKRGVSVDVFPLFDYQDEDSFLKRIIKTEKNMDIMYRYAMKCYKNDFLRTAFCASKKLLGRDAVYYREKLLKSEKESGRAEKCCCVVTPYREKDIHFWSEFEPILMEFEGDEFYAPRGYDAILTRIYGNYMKLPPVDKRIHTHDSIAYAYEE